jgi:HSF-type DNA-binding
VLQELQQRSFEAAELASFLRLHERAFGVQTQREAFQAQASSAADENRPVPSIVTSSSEDDCSTVTEVVECRSQPVCKSPKDASFVLQTLGSTFRTKEDTYIDASRIKNPGLPKTARGGKHVFFPDKLYKCLGDLQAEGKEDIACFLNHGRAFVVSNPEQFEQEVMPKYFDSIKKWSRYVLYRL